jgi:hypothetical protein
MRHPDLTVLSAPKIEYVKIAGDRHTGRFEPAERRRDLCVIHVFPRIGVAIDRDDSSMTRPFPVQLVQIFRVVSQQYSLERLGEIEHFRIWCSILIELANGDDIVSVPAQNLQLRAGLRVFVHQESQIGALASTSTFARFKRCRSSLASASISALLASQ